MILVGAGAAGDAAVMGPDSSAVGTACDFADAIEIAWAAETLAHEAISASAMH